MDPIVVVDLCPKLVVQEIPFLGGETSKLVDVHPEPLGKMDQFDDNIFANGWLNHQPVRWREVSWILTAIPPAPIFQGQRASSKDLRVIFIQNLLMRVNGEKMKKLKFFAILSFLQGGLQGVVQIRGGFHTLILLLPGHLHRGLKV